jgi:hypothetical protein
VSEQQLLSFDAARRVDVDLDPFGDPFLHGRVHIVEQSGNDVHDHYISPAGDSYAVDTGGWRRTALKY